MYRQLLKPLLFRLDAETAHHLTIAACSVAGRVPLALPMVGQLQPRYPELSQDLWGYPFSSVLGLAAGLDKNAEAVAAFSALGFGFLEVGTLTPVAQSGNPQPRLFRLPEDGALINRMGFNNHGLAAARHNLASHLATSHLAASHLAASQGVRRVPVWANIGKNKATPNEEAHLDYRKGVAALQDVADGFVVNVSSPNTPGLRALQQADDLRGLLAAVQTEAERQRVRTLRTLPVLVKLAPDLSDAELAASLDAALSVGVSGVILTNTTLSRDGLRSAHKAEAGGLSGRPLTARSTELVRRAYGLTGGKLPIVGVGGVFSAQDAYAKVRAGASLVELYTALIYEGPGLPARINRGLVELLRRDGFGHISEAVGVDA